MELYIVTGRGLARLHEEEHQAFVAEQVWEEPAVQCVTVDPKDPSVVYAGTRGQGAFKSADRGATWEDLEIPETDIFSLTVSPVDGSLYAGTEPSRLFKSSDGGITWGELEGLQDIPSRPEWSFPPRPETSHVRWIAPNPHDAELLLVGIELGGLMRSTDGGQTWSDHRPGAQKDVHALAWHPRAKGYAYEAGGGGPAWSKDSGATWQTVDEGLGERRYTWGLAVDSEDPDTWFVSASPGPRRQAHSSDQAQAAIYRWQGAGPWEELSGGLPTPLQRFPYALLSAGGRLFTGLRDGTLYVSEDKGDTWKQLALDGASLAGLRAGSI